MLVETKKKLTNALLARMEMRPSNPPSPTVTRQGSSTGASVDPRERSLVQPAGRQRGSTTKGRANIKAQVDVVSGSSKRNQRQIEERRRRARRRAMLKNRRQLIATSKQRHVMLTLQITNTLRKGRFFNWSPNTQNMFWVSSKNPDASYSWG